MKIYLDACCLSRLTDDQTQPRIREEADAVEKVLRMIREQTLTWISSPVLSLEISRTPDGEQRRAKEAILAFAQEIFVPDEATAAFALRIEKLGIASFDALHLACADQSGADVFLTTDDNLVRRARRSERLFRVSIENPVSWLREVQP